jgi:hypothetical protein
VGTDTFLSFYYIIVTQKRITDEQIRNSPEMSLLIYVVLRKG